MSGLNLLSTRKNSAAFAPGYAPRGFGDVAGAAFTNVRQNFTTDAEVRLMGDPLHTRNALIKERVGREIGDITGTNAKYTNPTPDGMAAQMAEDNNLIDEHIVRGRKEAPGIWDGIKTSAEIREEGKATAQKATSQFEETAGRNPNTVSRVAASVIGGIGGAFTDPVNIATLPIGAGPSRAVGVGAFASARGIAIAAGKEGLLQAAIEAASVPQIAQWQKTLGNKYGMAEAGTDVAFGFLGGAGLRAGFEGVIPALRGIRKGTEKASSYMLDQVAQRAPNMAQTVKDSLKYMGRTAYIDEDTPMPIRNPKDLQEHRAAVEKVGKDVEEYKRPAANVPGVKKIVTPRNELEVEVKDRIVELDDLITSDKAEYNQALQPRDRSNRVSSDVRINEIAARLDPGQLGDSRVSNTGSPIVGDDMMVESGNGRVMALSKVYEGHPESAKKYRDFLETQGHKLKGFKKPVLIRQRISELTDDERKKFVVFSNEDVADRLSTTERAMADAKLMNVSQYKGGDVDNALNAAFVRDFIDGAVSPAERNAFITPGGKVSQDGIKRVRAALLARAYGNADLVQKLLEDADNNIKTIGNVLMDLAGQWSKFRADIAAGNTPANLDITVDLMAAVETVINSRNANRPITDYINQAGLFAETDLTAETVAILRGMYNDKLTRPLGLDKTKEFLSYYLREAEKVQTGPSLLDEKQLQPMDILSKSLERLHGKEATAEFKFDTEASPEIAAVRSAGLEDLARTAMHPTTGVPFYKALEDMTSRPLTIDAPGYKGKERKALRKRILNKLMKDAGDVTPGKTMEIILGPPGAGKSSVIARRLQKELNAAVIDSDIVKERMPEFDGGMGANAVHAESKEIGEDWLAEAISRDWNIVHPIIGKDAESVGRLVDEMLSLGYTVNVRLVHIPAKESLKRVIARFQEEGRLVPPSYVMSIGDAPIKTFDNLKQREGINAYSYFDNNVKIGQEPIIIESNDPAYAPTKNGSGDDAGYGLQKAGEKGEETQGGEASEIDKFFDDNAYRLREYRATPMPEPDVEVKPTDRLEARKAEFDDLLKESPDMIIDLEDGSRMRLADYSDMVKQNENLITALTTCRLA